MLRHPGFNPDDPRQMPTQPATTDRSELYGQARGWLIAAASADILDHCAQKDRGRLLSTANNDLQNGELFIPELDEQTAQLADGVVEQAIATLAMLISKNCGINISKENN